MVRYELGLAVFVFSLGMPAPRALSAEGRADGVKRQKKPGAHAPAHASAPTPPRSLLALQMPGHWRWATGVLVDIFANGTMRGDNKEEGVWAVSNEAGRQVQLKWNAGWIDTVTVAADGNSFHGSNQHGTQVNATRVLTPAPSSPVPSGPSAPPVPPSSPPEK